jgi:hypothetical protein
VIIFMGESPGGYKKAVSLASERQALNWLVIG